MGKLIRADLFRARKINGFWIFTFFISLYMMVLPFVTVKADSAMTFFQGTLEGMAVAAMLIAMMPAYIMGRGYYHRTCMYEVMAGNSPFRIIFSKLISIALLISLIVCVSHLVGLGIASAMNSEGIVDVLAKEPMFLLTVLRFSVFGVLITMCVKSLLGPVLVYVRIMVESIAMIIASAATGTDLMEGGADLVVSNTTNKILNMTCFSQQGVLLSGEMNSSMVLQCVIGFAIEVLIWLVISYIIYKKKDY